MRAKDAHMPRIGRTREATADTPEGGCFTMDVTPTVLRCFFLKNSSTVVLLIPYSQVVNSSSLISYSHLIHTLFTSCE